jgi:hypothetical protein
MWRGGATGSSFVEAVERPAGAPAGLLDCSWLSFAISRAALPLTVAAGIAYVLSQHVQLGLVKDGIFVLLLIANTALLLTAEHVLRGHMQHDGLEFFEHAHHGDPARAADEHRQLFEATWASWPRILSGIAVGLFVAVTCHFIASWPPLSSHALLLSAFLFAVNYVLGAVLWSLARFLVACPRLMTIMTIDIWDMRNPCVAYITAAANRISLFAMATVALSLSSLYFSELPMNAVTYTFAAFCFLVIGLSASVPYVPILRQASAQKREAEAQVDRMVRERLGGSGTRLDGAYDAQAMAELAHLMTLRQHVEQLSVIPFKWRALTSALIVAGPLVLKVPPVQAWLARVLGIG